MFSVGFDVTSFYTSFTPVFYAVVRLMIRVPAVVRLPCGVVKFYGNMVYESLNDVNFWL